MNIDEFFDSKYLTAADLAGHEVKVIIDHVEVAEFKDGTKKPAIFFAGKKKGMALNKTNSNKLKAQWGKETDAWVGKEIILYPDVTDMQGRMVDCLRLRPVLPVVQAGAKNDDIPW